jgi:hypothetical protein
MTLTAEKKAIRKEEALKDARAYRQTLIEPSYTYSDFRFRPARKRPAAYFNNGNGSSAYEIIKGHEAPPEFLRAVEAAHKAFCAIWYPYSNKRAKNATEKRIKKLNAGDAGDA